MASRLSTTRATSSTPTVYYGELKCENAKCKNKAYWNSDGSYLCGVHSRGHTKRKALPKNPNAATRQDELMKSIYKEAIEAGEAATAAGDVSGSLFTRKMRMMKPLPMEDGCFTVLPNRKAGSKYASILAMPALSPMVLGPVVHNQIGLEPSLNLENFHQFNKVFASEVDSEGHILPIWYERQKKGYADPEPHRHKLGDSKAEHMKAAKTGENANLCLYSIFNGKRYSYVQSRVFYCTYYERLARKTQELDILADMLYEKRQSIVIAGYDARDILVDAEVRDRTISDWYNDESLPFGHEMVLYAILYFWHAPEKLPWKKDAEELGLDL